jgi:pre-mRNA cleavage complex 2 protein Pcf11
LAPFNGYPEPPQHPTQEPIAASNVAITSSSAPPTASISDLFKSLIKAGLVASNNNTPTGAGTSTQPLEEAKIEDLENAAKDDARRYAQRILSGKIRLTTSDITK